MARQARRKSKTGIYHVMLRGNERKAVFIDDEDKNKFVDIVLQKKKDASAFLYAYCVLDNHAHMILQEVEEGQALNTLMKRVGISYAVYFNKKYDRVGHVFQDRFRSEVIETEEYLLSAIRYIHQNPVKAGAAGLHYPWSSYGWYIGSKELWLPEMEHILTLFSVHKNEAIKSFMTFHEDEEEKQLFDVEENDISKGIAQDFLAKYFLHHNIKKEDINRVEHRDIAVEIIQTLVQQMRLSGRQVADLTGINREKVRTIILSLEPSL